VLKTSLRGTEAMVHKRIEAYHKAGVTTLRVEPAGDTLEARLATLGRLLELVRSLWRPPRRTICVVEPRDLSAKAV